MKVTSSRVIRVLGYEAHEPTLCTFTNKICEKMYGFGLVYITRRSVVQICLLPCFLFFLSFFFASPSHTIKNKILFYGIINWILQVSFQLFICFGSFFSIANEVFIFLLPFVQLKDSFRLHYHHQLGGLYVPYGCLLSFSMYNVYIQKHRKDYTQDGKCSSIHAELWLRSVSLSLNMKKMK